ncbi:MAG TPA: ATP-dependent Clp protease adaptor ClpS [Gemmataceae bacterium]|nr:ATP-dependent Clp protease adaptor ClpS [Gemmataceae bacterium]
MVPATVPETREESKVKRQPPYNVILENDDHHSMEFVVEVLKKVFSYPMEKCVQLMMQAHETGRSVVWTGAKEVAELKHEQIVTCHEKRNGTDLGPLGCFIEPAPG